MLRTRLLLTGSCVAALALTACATQTPDPQVAVLQEELQTKEEMLTAERSQASTLQSQVSELRSRLAAAEAEEVKVAAPLPGQTPDPELPPNASPGECYARVFVPPRYETTTETMLKQQAAERIETIPPRYEWVEETVMVREASERLEVVPAVFDMVEERVLVKEASVELVTDPPVYATEQEQVLVKPAYTTWKKGRGPIEKIDEATGEIMCLVTVPAEYKTVTRQVLQTPATARQISIPAEYKTVRKRVMIAPPKTRTVAIPAEFQTVRVNKLVTPAREQRIAIPAEYQSVTKRQMVEDGRMEWQSILCETNVNEDVVTRLQRALQTNGHSPGPIDGVIGRQTMAAVTAYQRERGLPSGQLTMETLKALDVGLVTN